MAIEFIGVPEFRPSGWFPGLDVAGWFDDSMATSAVAASQTEFWGMITW